MTLKPRALVSYSNQGKTIYNRCTIRRLLVFNITQGVQHGHIRTTIQLVFAIIKMHFRTHIVTTTEARVIALCK